jgi:hypothetical protein
MGKDHLAMLLHQDFKFQFVAGLARPGFEMTAAEIERWAAEAAKRLDLSCWEEGGA